MTRISDNKAHEIARSLASSTFKQKEEFLLYKVRVHLVDKTREIMGEGLYMIFCDKTRHFKSTRNLSLYPNGIFKAFFPKECSPNEIHPSINFPDIPLPQWDEWGEEILKITRPDDELGKALTELYLLEVKIRDFRKKVHCTILNSIRTDKRLKEEFPEAYDIMMKIENREVEMTVLSNPPCDTIENLRSIVQSNKPHEAGI